jgi:membrane protease YdiL (CAAX protease family)
MTTISSTIPLTKESKVKTFIKRNPLFSMYAIMFVLAWSVMIPQALYSQGILSTPVPMWLDLTTGWAPGIAAVVVTAITAGRTGVRELLGRFGTWRVGLPWYAIALFLLAAFILGGIGLHVLLGGTLPVIPAAGASVLDILLAFLLLLAVGVLINTEEIAWRGFALPRLQEKHNVLVACVLVAIPEVALHFPLFFDKENPFFQTVGLIWFSAFSVAAVFLYTFIFNKTKGSLLIVTLLHASQNTWANLLSDNTARPFYFTVALIWMVAVALIFITKGQLGYEKK